MSNEKVELTKNDDIKDIKRAIKCITVVMKSFVDNIHKLHDRLDTVEILDAEISNLRKTVDSFGEDMDTVEILGAEMLNLRKRVDSFEEDIDMIEILGDDMINLRKMVTDMKKE